MYDSMYSTCSDYNSNFDEFSKGLNTEATQQRFQVVVW